MIKGDFRLLHIDDSVDDATLLLKHLKKMGMVPDKYERVDTPEALSKALEGPWTIIICDYTLPKVDPIDALLLSNEKQPNTPFIIVSGSIGEDIAVKMLKAGADDYVMKNNLTRLSSAIEREVHEAELRLDKIKVENALKKSEEDLRQAQKLEAVGQLAGGIAHDFNNILAIISIQVDRLSEMFTDKPDIAEILEHVPKGLEQIKKTSDRATQLTRHLLAFSRKQIIQPKVMSPNDLVTDLKNMIRRMLEENIELKTSLASDLKNIKADPSHLEQIILNLVVNSRDAMASGGTITIETKNDSIEDAVAKINNVRKGDYICLSVSDTGMGMDKETQKHIFEPFFTTKEVGKGTGLGLSTVYGIVKQNHGLIFVESEPGKGATFKIYFPVSRDQSLSGEIANNKTAPTVSGGHETILVVEDEEDFRSLICDTLKQQGYTVLDAPDGLAASEILMKRAQPIDLIISDIVMPKMGGVELARTAQEKLGALKILFLSGYTSDVLLRQGLADGQIHFLEKPFNTKALLVKIRSILD